MDGRVMAGEVAVELDMGNWRVTVMVEGNLCGSK